MKKKNGLDLSAPIFITGIGTDVGKTIVSAIMCEWKKGNYWKPIQSGDPDGGDSKTLKNLVSHESFEIYKEAFRFTAPLSPHAAAKLEGRNIEVAEINLPISKNPLIVEGAGGLMVPLNYENETICDLIIKLNAQVVVVVKEYLGNKPYSFNRSTPEARRREYRWIGFRRRRTSSYLGYHFKTDPASTAFPNSNF